jgi:hypothetical protein
LPIGAQDTILPHKQTDPLPAGATACGDNR